MPQGLWLKTRRRVESTGLVNQSTFGPADMQKGMEVEVLTPDGHDTATVLAWGEKGVTVELSNGLRGGIAYQHIVQVVSPSLDKLSSRAPTKSQQNQGGKFSTEQVYQSISPEAVQLAADQHGIPWRDPDFVIWCEQTTGRRHLDEMTPADLQAVKEAMERGERPAPIHQYAEVVAMP